MGHDPRDDHRQPKPRPANDGVLYIPFNVGSEAKERAALTKSGATVRTLDGIASHRVTIANHEWDFSKPNEAQAFVDTLRLDPRQAEEVARVIERASQETRGKLAEIAVVFAEAAHGSPIPSRLVISAHSGGDQFYGEHGYLHPDDLRALARAIPDAGQCIRDVHFSACSSSGKAQVKEERDKWLAAFPNLKSMWGYTGTTGHRELGPHLEAWRALPQARMSHCHCHCSTSTSLRGPPRTATSMRCLSLRSAPSYPPSRRASLPSSQAQDLRWETLTPSRPTRPIGSSPIGRPVLCGADEEG